MSEFPIKDERKRRIDDDPSLEPPYPAKRQQQGNDHDSKTIIHASAVEGDNHKHRRTSSGKATRSDHETQHNAVEVPCASFRHRILPAIDRCLQEDADGDIPGSGVLAFQKEAIWRQMQAYKRRCTRATQRIQQLEQNQTVYEASLILANTYMHKVYEDLKHFLSRADGDADNQKSNRSKRSEHPYQSELLKAILEPISHEKEVQGALVQTWEATNEVLADLLQKVDRPRNDAGSNNGVADPLAQERAKVDQLQARVHTLSMQMHELEGKLLRKQKKLNTVNEELSETGSRLTKCERRLDRAKHTAAPAAHATVYHDEHPERPKQADTDTDSVTFIAEIRLGDVNKLHAQKVQLMEELDKLRLQVANSTASDELVRELPLYRNLDDEYRYQLNENELLKQRLDKLAAELDEVRQDRTKIAEDLETEEHSRRKITEAELRKLETDLTRIRGHRDQLQQNLDLRGSKDEAEMHQLQEIKVLANTRKDRILCLEQDILRLKTHMAASSGDRALMKFFEDFPDDANPLADLRQKLKDAQRHIHEMEDRLATYKGAGSSDRPPSSSRRWREQVDELQDSLNTYKRLFGDAGSESEAIKRLIAKEKEQREELEKCQCVIDAYQKTESRLATEIETLGKAWAELEEQNSRKVLDLAEKEDTILRLLAERTKYDQKCTILTKQSATANNLVIALRRQSDKQLETIRVSETREKALTQQLHLLEREVSTHKASFDQQQRLLAEHMREITALKDSERSWTLKYENATAMLKKQVTLLEQEAEERRTSQEAAALLQRKLEKMGKTEQVADAGLQKELEQYKLLLKCSSCNNKFKSHVLNKCMHTFCKGCIDEMYNSRQRKCPTCGIAFGIQDIRQVYL
ncbi:E3 ubiquitin-protein ligase bre1 [Thoreauomyces humboldtii]|nr:E3 ubiquitin-protein ligase bre1 [Thoreauomyces humboldtii]